MEKSEYSNVKSLNKPTRKLVAILFADIVGYTALMQKGENNALKILNKFESVMDSYVPEYSGEIIKCYGDGCLVLFDSAVNAVKCSQRIQESLQDDVYVPLRIGIHIGDIIIKGNDVFGDGVNVSSRIESMGVPGTILLSDLVYDKVKNQEQFDFKLMGNYHFKNVDQSMDVFCLANNGIVVPKKEQLKGKIKETYKNNKSNKTHILIATALLLILIASSSFLYQQNTNTTAQSNTLVKSHIDKNVAVLVFKNESDITEFNSISYMATDWITNKLLEVHKGKVINQANVKSNMHLVNDGNTQEFAIETGAEILIQGRCYKVDNTIYFNVDIVDTSTGNIIEANTFNGPIEQVMETIEDMSQTIIGYWATKGIKAYERKPPKYDAYKLYLEAESVWATNINRAESLLLEAYSLDSSYYVPLLKLFPLYINSGDHQKRDSLLIFLSNQDTNFSTYENYRFETIKAAVAGKNDKAASIYGQMTEFDPSLAAYMAAMYNIYIFNLDEAKKYLKIDMSLPGKKEDLMSQSSCGYLLQILLKEEKYNKVIDIINSLPYQVIDATIAGSHLTSLLMTQQTDRFNEIYEEYDQSILKPHNSIMLSILCNHLYLRNDTQKLNHFIDIYKSEMNENTENIFVNYLKGDMHYMSEEYDKAAHYYKQESFNGISDYSIACQIKAGNDEIAAESIKSILQITDPEKLAHKHYILAQYYTAKGNYDKAISNVKSSIQLAYPYTLSNYTEDPLLKELHTKSEFIDLFKIDSETIEL